MQNGHLNKHSIARLMDYDASWAIKHTLGDDYVSANWKTMHKARISSGVLEPWFVDAPIDEFVAERLVRELITVMPG